MLVVETLAAAAASGPPQAPPAARRGGRGPARAAALAGHRGARRRALRRARRRRSAGWSPRPTRRRPSTPSSPRASRSLNRALFAQGAAAADPHVRELTALEASAVRIGYGSGEEVAAGRYTRGPLRRRPGDRRLAPRPARRGAAAAGAGRRRARRPRADRRLRGAAAARPGRPRRRPRPRGGPAAAGRPRGAPGRARRRPRRPRPRRGHGRARGAPRRGRAGGRTPPCAATWTPRASSASARRSRSASGSCAAAAFCGVAGDGYSVRSTPEGGSTWTLRGRCGDDLVLQGRGDVVGFLERDALQGGDADHGQAGGAGRGDPGRRVLEGDDRRGRARRRAAGRPRGRGRAPASAPRFRGR